MRLLVALFALLAFNAPAGAEIHEVLVDSNFFSPDAIDVNVGDTVRWVWVSGIHTTTSGTDCTPDGLWNAPLDEGNPDFEHTFDTAGVFDYFCMPHCIFDMVGVVNVEGSSSVDDPADLDSIIGLRASPNPAPGRTRFQFGLSGPGTVRLHLTDAAGRRVAEVWSGELGAGVHSIDWRGLGDSGDALAAGIYFAELTTPEGRDVAKVFLVR